MWGFLIRRGRRQGQSLKWTASSSAEKQKSFAPPPRRPTTNVVQNRGVDDHAQTNVVQNRGVDDHAQTNVVQNRGIDPKIQQARDCAVAQAQQDSCMGNFKIFDSPFGNFLVPVIPTREELSR
ncbi:hypothetical protein AgCh_027108 [Apium graveolens]